MDDLATAPRPGLRGLRLAGLVVGAGVLLGLADLALQGTPLRQSVNSIASWAGLGFLIGALVAPPASRAARAAGGALGIALAAWYAVAQAVDGVYGWWAVPKVALWFAAAAVAGAVFGTAGNWWRHRRDSWRAGLGLATLVALFAVQGGRTALVLGDPVWGGVQAALAVALLVGLGAPLPRRRDAALLVLPLMALGTLGYAGFALAGDLLGGS